MLAVLFCLSCSGCRLLSISFRLFFSVCPLLFVLPWLSLPSSPIPSSPALAALSRQSFPDSPVMAVSFCLSVLPVPFWLTCSGCPVLAVLFWLCCSAVLFWLSSPFCSTLAVSSQQSCAHSPVLAILSCNLILIDLFRFWLYRFGCTVLAVLTWQSSTSVLAWLSDPSCPVLATLPGQPVLAVMTWQPYPGSPFHTGLFCQSCSACPVLNVLFCLARFGCPAPPVALWWMSCSSFPSLPVSALFACPVLFFTFCLSCSTYPVLPVLFCQYSFACLILSVPF